MMLSLTHSANGRVSGKSWKSYSRSHISSNPKNWHRRIDHTKKNKAVKNLEKALKDEKQAELHRRRQITLERKKAAEEKRRLEEAKAKIGAHKAARLRRKAGRSKKVNH